MPPMVKLHSSPQVFTRTLAPPSPEALTQFLLLCIVIIHVPLLSAAQNVLYRCLAEDDVWWEMLLQPSLGNTFCYASKCYRNTAAHFQHSMKWSRHGIRGGLQTKPTHFNYIQKTFIENISFPTAEFLPMYLLLFIMCSLYYLRPVTFGNMLTLLFNSTQEILGVLPIFIPSSLQLKIEYPLT